MENKDNNISTSFSLSKMFYFRWKLILIITILGIALGSFLSVMRNTVTYKASKSVMLVTKMDYSDIDLDNAVTGDIIDDVVEHIKTPGYVEYVNDTIEDGPTISRGGISISRNNANTFIFTISYTASSPEIAESGLEKIIEFSNIDVFDKEEAGKIIKENYFEFHTAADTITVKPVQYEARIKANSNLAKNIILSIIASVVGAIGIAILVGLFDNAITDKGELEEITGVNLLSLIEDTDVPVKTKKKKRNKK